MTLNIFTHKNLLIQILKELYTDPTISFDLGFKGGTAAMLFCDLPRFSVDLDFDLLNPVKESVVFEKIKAVLATYGTVKEADKKRFCLFFLLSYANKAPGAYNIKVEVNLRNFGSKYEVKPYFGIPMNVMIPADMAAHKMVAMLERAGNANRDIFDTHFFLKNSWPLNETIIEQRTGMKIAPFLQKCIDTLTAMNDTHILAGLGELLDAKQKAWVKAHLRENTVFLLKIKLDNAQTHDAKEAKP